MLIIEDEWQTALDLKNAIENVRPSYVIQTILDSVESGLEWFSGHASPDLVFSDIQLGDGLAFDIFRRASITCPVIFCTAYDEYAINAFQHNGIDYLLKPVSEKHLAKSLEKIDLFIKPPAYRFDISSIQRLLQELESNKKSYKSNFLVSYREKMIPINVDDICFFCIRNNSTQLHTKDNKTFTVPQTLEYLEAMLDPQLFYRANRQSLVAFSAIKEVEHYFERKLLVKLHQPGLEPIIISKGKASDFLQWMDR